VAAAATGTYADIRRRLARAGHEVDQVWRAYIGPGEGEEEWLFTALNAEGELEARTAVVRLGRLHIHRGW